jgi:hypothetical protein
MGMDGKRLRAEGESDAIAMPYNASLALPVSTDFLINREYQLT